MKQTEKGKRQEEFKKKVTLAIVILHPLTSHHRFDLGLTGADMVGGHTFVCSAVTELNVGYQQPSIPRNLGSCSKAPAPTAPREVDGVGPVGQTLHMQGIPRSKT